MILQVIALFCCGSFFGAALYIALAQHPATLEAGVSVGGRFFPTHVPARGAITNHPGADWIYFRNGRLADGYGFTLDDWCIATRVSYTDNAYYHQTNK